MEGTIVGDDGNGVKWILVGYVRGGGHRTRSGQTSPRPACAACGPISRQAPPFRRARTPPPLRVRHPANDAGGEWILVGYVAFGWRGRSGAQRRPGADRQAPVPRAWRAAPPHGRRLPVAAIAIRRRCVCDIPPARRLDLRWVFGWRGRSGAQKPGPHAANHRKERSGIASSVGDVTGFRCPVMPPLPP